jgi:hypothetical protein
MRKPQHRMKNSVKVPQLIISAGMEPGEAAVLTILPRIGMRPRKGNCSIYNKAWHIAVNPYF